MQLAKAAIDAGQLGELVFATWRFGGEGGWGGHPQANLIETQCHGFDMLEHLCGPIASLAAEMTDVTGVGFSTMALSLKFANGAVGSLVGSYDSSYAYPETHRLEINGTDGRILIDDTVKQLPVSPRRGGNRARSGKPVTSTTWIANSTAPLIDTSKRCSTPSSAMPSRRCMLAPVIARVALAWAAIESHESGRRVSGTVCVWTL